MRTAVQQSEISDNGLEHKLSEIATASEAETSFTVDPRNTSIIRDNHFEKDPNDRKSDNDSGGDFEAEAFVPKVVDYMLFTKEPSRVEDKKLKQEKMSMMSLESAEEQ